MKRITLLLLLLILVYSGYSKQIDENSARQVAKTYFNNVLNTTEIASTDFVLSDKFIDNASLLKDNSPQTVYFYIFNLTNNNGFIIVSGDDNVEPVLGYSTKGNYSNTNLSPEFSYWLEGYKKQIKYVIENKVNATETINQTWNNLIQGTYSLEKSHVQAVAFSRPLARFTVIFTAFFLNTGSAAFFTKPFAIAPSDNAFIPPR